MYCAVSDIKAYCATDQLRNKQLPPDGELLSLAEQIAGELDGFLELNGYDVPPTDAVLLEYLKTANAMGTAALVDVKLRPAGEAMVNDLEAKYKDIKKLLADHAYHPLTVTIPDKDTVTW